VKIFKIAPLFLGIEGREKGKYKTRWETYQRRTPTLTGEIDRGNPGPGAAEGEKKKTKMVACG